MKKLVLSIVAIAIMAGVYAQKKNGTVFIEHPAMEKVTNMWQAFAKGDSAAFVSFFADSVHISRNDRKFTMKNAELPSLYSWWIREFDAIRFEVDTPAYADAIEYEKGGLWVQDWIRVAGTHTKTGINLDLPTHNLYRFNDDGKISVLIQYYNNDLFQEINNSERTIKNGVVYINHPYILSVRKYVNALCAKDMDELMSYFSPKAGFASLMMDWGDSFMTMEQQKDVWQMIFDNNDNMTMTQFGYPDCIYYEKNGDYVVYSWWVFRSTSKEGKKIEMPVMLSDTFDEEGKIVNSVYYYSTNHLE
ncbi:nuclear transport factor 2 family protein [Mangrovibacterium sp.]|uniref:nuclear transport factor 2 family protein n=1 Tax=Mangrovibacterium sp. TaxID=1961364 RepID=UPI003568E071